MKKTIKIFFILIIASISFITMSCDEIGSFDLNMPFSDTITVEGSNSVVSESFYYCLDELDDWDEYREEIESIEYLSASVWVISYSPANLTGIVTVTVNDSDGMVIFSDTLPSNNPNDYIGKPYTFQLTEDEITTYNAILSEAISSDDPTCFNGVLEVSGITGDPPYELLFRVEIIHKVGVKGS